MMKKYWILIVISVVMIASVGTFYIQSVIAANNLPAFTIEKKHGDEKEIASLFMAGYYYDELTYIGEEFTIGIEGTDYWRDKSFLGRIDHLYDSPIYYSPQIKQLQKEYRNFMRGKSNSIHSYFENEDSLVYADVLYIKPYTVSSEFEFTIAILDKKTNKTTPFKQHIPNGGDFWYLDVMKVQIVDDQLKVITRNDVKEEDREEIHLYTFDIGKEVLINDEVILSSKDLEDKYTDISTLGVDDPTGETEYMGFVKTTTDIDDEGYSGDVVDEELVIYDLPLNTSKVINIDNPIEYGHLDGSNIYFHEIDEDGALRNAVYDLESEQIVDEFVVELSNNLEGWNRKINDGKLYFVHSYTDSEPAAFVTVINLQNGEILFEGEVKYEDQQDLADKAELSIQEILLK